jgi:hypothetical protein
MAIVATASILTSAAELPSGYTPPTLPTLTVDEDGDYEVDLSISNADPADPNIGLNNVLGAAKTDFEGFQATKRGLDATKTINVNLLIRSVVRTNTQSPEDGGIFITGTEVYRCKIYFAYEVV